jgi:hypothetical protein
MRISRVPEEVTADSAGKVDEALTAGFDPFRLKTVALQVRRKLKEAELSGS